MGNRTKLHELIDQLDHRLERAAKAHHNTRDWIDEYVSEGSDFVGTYAEWIDQAFAQLRYEANSLASTSMETSE